VSKVSGRTGASVQKGFAMKLTLRKFLADESGATAIEYALLAACISLAIISGVNGVGKQLSTKFASITTSLR
jgi:pilus assembly protein Flp/PilA